MYVNVYDDLIYPTNFNPSYISVKSSLDYYGPLHFKSVKIKRFAKKLVLKASLKQDFKPLKNKKIILSSKTKNT